MIYTQKKKKKVKTRESINTAASMGVSTVSEVSHGENFDSVGIQKEKVLIDT